MSGLRSYGDPCGIARALDLVGERWSLLIVRELLLGPKRFTDLRAGLPGAGPNVLSQRLRDLEDAGITRRRRLGPPAGSQVYELTERGAELEPVVLALGRWGSRTPVDPGIDAKLSVDALMLALKTTFDPHAAGDLRASFELRFGADRFRLRVALGGIELTRGGAESPDAVLDTDVRTFRALVFGGLRPADALRSGDLGLIGDPRAATRMLRLFPVSVPGRGAAASA